MQKLNVYLSVVLVLAFVASGCDPEISPEEQATESLNSEYGKPLMSPLDVVPKDDNITGVSGLPVSVDDGPMVVWKVENQWDEVGSLAALEPGLAWPGNSGLTWNEKYASWIDSLQPVDGAGGSKTFTLTTPEGRSIQAPYLECAETAIFLRAAFASWYKLPFFMSAWTPEGTVYFGHFGIRYEEGRYGNMPNFRDSYTDYSSLSAAEYEAEWPSDSSLAKRFLTLKKDDTNFFLGEGMYTGAYLDQVFLNKRAGHFMLYLLTYLGSIHLASTANTYHLQAEEVREGDVLLHRWKKQGVGHTMIVMRVNEEVGDKLKVELSSGSMPRRQPKWESSTQSKYNFTVEKAGGPGLSGDGYAFSSLGGGLRRWRHAQAVDGRYYNVVGNADSSHFISSSDGTAIAERVTVFENLLTELAPAEKRDALVEMIQSERAHLSNYPSSCAARSRREALFEDLYTHQLTHFEQSREEVDDTYRVFEDYVFGELEYDQSRTCCWNSTNNDMYEAIVTYAQSIVDASETCIAPPVFKMVDGGYDAFRAHAESVGVEWVEWSADEQCPQADTVSTDLETSVSTAYCNLNWDDEAELAIEETVLNDGCMESDSPGCDGCSCEACVCARDAYCCNIGWDESCVALCGDECDGGCL